jgi:hypothetical protein
VAHTSASSLSSLNRFLSANEEDSTITLAELEGWRRCVKCRTMVEVRSPLIPSITADLFSELKDADT